MKAVISVLGKDRVGIIARVSGYLADQQVNILDISQTILQDYFVMIMLVAPLSESPDLPALAAGLREVGEELGVQITLQHEAVFAAMHRV